MKISVGDTAPDFTLYSADKQEVSLSGQRGKNVVLLFFPLAFSGVCTDEVCQVRDEMSAYNGMNAEVFGLSVDSVYCLDAFRNANQLNFTLLSDFNKSASKDYGVLHETFGYGMKGVSMRSAFVIDGPGVIRYAEITENPGVLPNFDAIAETLNALN